MNYAQGAIAEDVVLEIGGKNGFEAFSFAAGSSIEDMATAINLVSDALGVTAEVQTEATAGSITMSSFGPNSDVVLTANETGFQAGDVRVKYTTGASLQGTYVRGNGSDPGTLEIQLEESAWTAASYFIGDNDAVALNDLVVTSRFSGADYNGWTFTVGAAGANSVVVDTTNKTVTVTSVLNQSGQIATNLANDAVFNALFTVAGGTGNPGPGVGVIVAAAYNTQITTGADGGTILTTANDIVDLINNGVDGVDGTGLTDLQEDVTAALATADDGYGLATAFQEAAYYGTTEANNYVQFLGVEDAQNIEFVSEAGTDLSVSVEGRVEGFSNLIMNLGMDEGTIKLSAKQKGAEYDDVTVKFAADTGLAKGTGFAIWDAENKEITVYANQGTDDVQDVMDYINNDEVIGDVFRADLWGKADSTAVLDAITAGRTIGETSGGVVSEGTVTVHLATDANGLVTTTAQQLVTYFENDPDSVIADLGISASNVAGSDGSGLLAATTSDIEFSTSGTTVDDSFATATVETSGGINSMFDITAKIAGAAYDGVTIQFEDTAAVAANPTFAYNANTKVLTIGIVDGATTVNDLISDIANYEEVDNLFSLALTQDIYGTATDSSGAGVVRISDTATLAGGTTVTGTPTGVALLGNEDEANTGLTFKATEYGSDSFISVKSLNGGAFATTDTAGNAAERVAGTNVEALINGVRALGKGLTATINTSALDVSFSVSTSMTDGSSTAFSIVGGGATFQLGPDVVSNQQARLGITSVNTAKLGGVSGRLYELRSGNAASLENDVINAAAIVEETITSIVTLRGRLGAFQATTLESNIASLEDTLENLTEAESNIRDADFAEESAKLTRNQILVQSGTSVLAMANQNPQAVLSLLR
ncbi:MAG: flagellin [Thermoguttaceae bacterium]